MARLGELLDQSLPLSIDQRRAWLGTLSVEDAPLRKTLTQALLGDDPAPLAGRLLDQPPGAGATAPPPEHQPGRRLGAYELLRPLGAGGMAEVWLARRADGAFEREVALKIPRLGHLPAEMAGRFARECQILASLEVPGIARLYDAGVDDGVPYIAMEYVPGEPLTRKREIGRAARIALFLQVLEAVGRAHARQVIHRDLKPSNILVTPEGEVRLLDFGIARLLQAETGNASVTQAWGRALTPEYASPEMLRGGTVDARSDIYSLGVVLHEMLTGSRPDGDALNVKGGLQAVLAKALSPSPDDRFASAEAFAEALRPFAEGKDPAHRSWPRYALIAGVAAALVVAGLLARRHSIVEAPAAATTSPLEVSLAVLPFADLSAARDQEYLSEGMADEIINQLAQVPGVRLVGLRSTLTFKGRNEDLRVIGEKLGVDNLLDGTIRTDGNRLRIATQLLRARDGTPLWSNVYDRELRDVFAVQEDIARDVAKALSVKLDVGPLNRAQGGTTHLDAYDRYLRWRQLFLAERVGIDNRRMRVQLLREAVQFDPRFALAWGELADELEILARNSENLADQVGGSQAASLRDESGRARARAQELAPTSWIAMRIRSEQLANEGRWAEAIEVSKQILDSGPFTLERAYPYTNVIFAVGRIDETIALVERVIRVEPLVMFPSRDQQWNLTSGRRYQEATSEYRRSRDFEGSHTMPEYVAFLRTLALGPSDDGDLRAAYQRYRQNIKSPGRDVFYGELDAVLDDRDALRVFIRKVIDERRSGFENAYGVADAVGESEAALAALRAYLEQRANQDFARYWELWTTPYSNVRTLPGFRALLRDAGIVDYWRQSGQWGDFCKPTGPGPDDFECR
jgi:serine/threonine protein kinase/tetratricopeptide (TPR) repeat protein